jgi:1-acyl-sn-glycerol-3-phosphate acyltransferase
LNPHQKTHKILQPLSQWILRTIGWRVEITWPSEPKYVMIGAPHTSNWDLFYTLLMVYSTGMKLNWIGKHSLFWWPLGAIMRRLGGVPVVRHSRRDFVQQIVDVFNQADTLVIAIAPEGTRSRSPYWKSGFYYMAQGAGVPIVMGYIDYPSRTVGIGPSFYPTGDLAEDFKLVQEFYGSKRGKYRRSEGSIQLKPA